MLNVVSLQYKQTQNIMKTTENTMKVSEAIKNGYKIVKIYGRGSLLAVKQEVSYIQTEEGMYARVLKTYKRPPKDGLCIICE